MSRTPADVFSPGEFIREEMDARGWSLAHMAAVAGLPVFVMEQILAGQMPLGDHHAEQLGRAFDTSTQLWLNLEASYRAQAPASDIYNGRTNATAIWLDPGRCGGDPCIYNTRIPVDTITGYLVHQGMEAVLEAWNVTREHVLVAVWFAARYGSRKERRLWKAWAAAHQGAMWASEYDKIPDPPRE
jgi:plasmid maintenance system antidote protein VapI